jgi:hypothetical protein
MLLELFFLGLILLGIYIIIKILQKFFRIFFKFYRYIGERLIIRKFVYSFRKNKQIYLNKIINFILPLLKKNPQMYDK